MAVVSKIFYEVSAGKSCCDLWHPENPSCVGAIAQAALSCMPGSYQFYLPLLVIPPLLKGEVTWEYLLDHTLDYSAICWRTYIQALISFTSVCGLYNLLGKLHFFTLMAIPGFFAAAFTPSLPIQHLRLQGITYFNMMLEVIIRKSDLKIVKTLRSSKLFGAFCFMTFTAVITNVLKQHNTRQLWLIMPDKIEMNSINKMKKDDSKILGKLFKTDFQICSHDKSCDKHIVDGILKYGAVGIILEVSRALISKFPVLIKNPRRFLPNYFKALGIRMPLFLASYVGLFRIIECILTRHHKKEDMKFAKYAGFLSGVSYLFYPKYQVFTLGFTKAVELYWEFLMRSERKLPKILHFIDGLPILKLVHMFSISHLYHTSIFYPHLEPYFNKKAMNLCSENRVENMKMNYYSWVLENANKKIW